MTAKATVQRPCGVARDCSFRGRVDMLVPVVQCRRAEDGITHRPQSSSFLGFIFDKVIPKRNYFGAYG